MKYAILNSERIEPQKGIKDAVCPICGEIVVPKCGQIKIHHWAHQSTINCDSWWESETEWHRKWKDNFPKECQEIIMHDNITGEKHVADVKTKSGIVIEFQHSPMNIEEQKSREQFYKNMIWVVDARKYYEKFKQNIECLNHCESNQYCFYQEIDYSEKQANCFPKRWLESSVPVIFDFGIYDDFEDNEHNKQKKWLWCVFPEKFTKILSHWCDEILCGLCIKKESLIKRVTTYSEFYPNIVLQELEELRIKLEQERQEREKLYKKQQKELSETKYQKEEKWRDAIYNIKLDIKRNNLNSKKLYISENGEILDSDKRIYNGKKCMVLGIKSYPSTYNGNEYTRNDVLMLVEYDNNFLTTIIHIPSYILHDYSTDFDLLYGNYNYYIRTISAIPYYDKYSIGFENDERIFTTKQLKKDLEFICNNFK